MQNVSRRISQYILFIFGITIFYACQPSEERPNDKDLPAIIVTGIHDGDSIRNIVNLQVEAKDNSGIKKIELYFKDSLLFSTDSASFRYKFNSTKFADGEYAVKAMAYDKYDNKQELFTKVIIDNALITLRNFPGKIFDYQYWYVITDSAGQILNSIKCPDNAVSEIKIAPKEPFYGKTFNVYQILKYNRINISAYLDLKKGAVYNLSDKTPIISHPYIGPISLNFKNILPFDRLTYSGNSGGTSITSLKDTAERKSYFSEGSKLFVQVERNGVGYYNFYDVSVRSKSLDVDMSLCNKISERKTIKAPGLDVYFATLSGKPELGYENYYMLNYVAIPDISPDPTKPYQTNLNREEVTFFYPKESIVQYQTWVQYHMNEWHGINNYKGDIPSAVKPIDFNMEFKNTSIYNLQLPYTGNVSYQYAYFSDPDNRKNIYIYSHSTLTNYKFPDLSSVTEIPADLPGFKLKSINIFKIETLFPNTIPYPQQMDGRSVIKEASWMSRQF
ncbi:hypothetical protein GS399_11150 [Pedobacter sp. HMF7647]|uniref:Uncharacterized protein n=1 Tax=Hufsiella arboris TaxID=2695275 RepID=A0A7K1YBW4_9SPHI|nr:Ig-like domain-containing protein [Hufsiella arboris]MXV51528.1 hypothetical protein [Hufsiella arboris]